MSGCNRDHVAHEALNLYLLVPNRTSLLWRIAAEQHHLALTVSQPQPMSDEPGIWKAHAFVSR